MKNAKSWLILCVMAPLFLAVVPGCNPKNTTNDIPVRSFYKPAENPILRADSSFIFPDPLTGDTVRWQRADVFNPAAILRNGKVFLLYRCEDNPAAAIGGRTSRLGLAESEDGIHFTKHPQPVLFPAEDSFKSYEYPGGCEDPRLAQTGEGLYVVAYTAWNSETARLCIAFSRDLEHWEKKGPAFARAYDGKFRDTWSKSASMITKFENGRQVLAKIDGKYWMYWGEKLVNLAWSENLSDWYPLLDETGELKAVIRPRDGMFDSDLTECGPPAVILDGRITLFYNGKNATGDHADPSLPKGTYSVGRLVLDADDPGKVIERSDTCFLKPTLPHEISGQYQAGTTFAEGLVFFNGKWYLYYGTADSYVGVAITGSK